MRAGLQGLVRVGGTLVLELAPGPGERSRYLRRLPAGSVARLLRSAPTLVAQRVRREGFVGERPRKRATGAFDRLGAAELQQALGLAGFDIEETLAVAPSLGPDPERIAAVACDAKAWDHLLTVEELLGRDPERWRIAAAVLVAATRRSDGLVRPGSALSDQGSRSGGRGTA